MLPKVQHNPARRVERVARQERRSERSRRGRGTSEAHGTRAAMDETAKKDALRLFTYGLYAITCGDGQERNAFTANWVTQVSFEPPLIALSVQNDSHSLPIIRRTRHFAVNVFASDERELAGRLGKPYARQPGKLEGLDFGRVADDVPVLAQAPAWVACAVIGELPAGDSTLLLARVVDAAVPRRVEPLTMLAAGFKHAG